MEDKYIKDTDISDDNVRTLNTINDFPHIGLIYYPNSGENVIRKALEMIFKIKTQINIKSDYFKETIPKDMCPNNNSLDMGWITATDYPLRDAHEYEYFDISLGILVVRNPADVMSTAVFKGKIILENEMKELPKKIEIWEKFYKFWIKAPIPIYIIKYEEFKENSIQILKDLTKFILGLDSIDNSKICYRIDKFRIDNIPNEYLPYKSNISFKNEANVKRREDIINCLQSLNKINSKLLYDSGKSNNLQNSDDDYFDSTRKNWLKDYNEENIKKSIEMQENISISMYSSNYLALKIC